MVRKKSQNRNNKKCIYISKLVKQQNNQAHPLVYILNDNILRNTVSACQVSFHKNERAATICVATRLFSQQGEYLISSSTVYE